MINEVDAKQQIKNLKKEYSIFGSENLIINTEYINKSFGYVELIHINPYNFIEMVYLKL